MCDDDTRTVLETCFARRVALGQVWASAQEAGDDSVALDPDAMFTGLDITREAQIQHGQFIRHNDVKDEYTRIWSGGIDDYEREPHPTLPGHPLVYYPNGADVNQYDPTRTPTLDGRPNGLAVAAVGVGAGVSGAALAPQLGGVAVLNQPGPGPVVAPAPLPPNALPVDQRGRACIPNDFVAKLGLKTSDWAAATVDGDVIRVSVKGAVPAAVASQYHYRVDRSGNIRISPSLLQQAGITGGFEVIEVNGEIHVKNP